MALFCAAIKRDSGFVVLWVIVLSVLFLVAVISLSPHLWSSSRFINASTLSSILASPLSPSFLDTYSLSTSSLGWNALYMVISFLVLCSICLSSSLVYFKNGSEYLTRRTAQVFIPLKRFHQDSLVLSCFLILLKYSFLIFSFTSFCLMGSASNILHVFVGLLFSECSNSFLIW